MRHLNWPLFAQGARDTIPLLIAAAPFGAIFGALAHSAGLSSWAVMGMSLIVFAGSSQFIAVGLLAASTAIPLIIATTFFVNLRHMLYATSLMPHVSRIPQLLRAPIAFWLTDETYAVVIGRVNRERDAPDFATYYFGSAISMYSNWALWTFIGLMLGQQIPEMRSWGLDIAMVLAFVGIVVPALKTMPMLACALVAAVTGLLTHDWANQSGLLLSSVLAIAVGVFLEMRQKRNGHV